MKKQSDFIANKSHEVRTALNTIIGLAEVLKQSNIAEEEKHLASIIHSSGENLLKSINEILGIENASQDSL